MKKIAIYLFYVIIGLSTAMSAYIIFTGQGAFGFNLLSLLIVFIAISSISLYFLQNKKDDTFF